MRGIVVITLMLFVTACSRQGTPASAYRHTDDRLKALLGGVIGYPCARKVKDYIESTPDDECYRLTASHRMRGIWINEFEGSNFIENAQTIPEGARSLQSRTWLRKSVETRNDASLIGNIYSIDFIGRRSIVPGSYGHMGGSQHLVLADRLISLRKIATVESLSKR